MAFETTLFPTFTISLRLITICDYVLAPNDHCLGILFGKFIRSFTFHCYGLLASHMVPGGLVPLHDQYILTWNEKLVNEATTLKYDESSGVMQSTAVGPHKDTSTRKTIVTQTIVICDAKTNNARCTSMWSYMVWLGWGNEAVDKAGYSNLTLNFTGASQSSKTRRLLVTSASKTKMG